MGIILLRMIYRRKATRSPVPVDFIRLQEEKTKARLTGFSADGSIRLKDEQGNVWAGVVERSADNILRYRLKDAGGRHMTGVANAGVRVFRDDFGRIWKGIAD